MYQKYVEFRPAIGGPAWNQQNRRFVRWVFCEDRARFAKDRASPAKGAKLRGRIARTRFIRQHLVVQHSQPVVISAWWRRYRILFQVFELTAHTRRVRIRKATAFALKLLRNWHFVTSKVAARNDNKMKLTKTSSFPRVSTRIKDISFWRYF